jgi:hypothetical protein
VVTKTDYFELYSERPRKFTAEEVEFMPEAEDDRLCSACINWFYSPSLVTSVCQILRLENDGNIPATASCKFWTKDNENFPHLEESDAGTDR